MLSYDGIATNFRFMVAQVVKQLEDTLRQLDAPSERRRQKIYASDDYVDTQKSLLQNACFLWMRHSGEADLQAAHTVRALNTIVSNLEHIADYSVDVARQITHLGDPSYLRRFGYRAYFDVLLEALRAIDQAIFHRDSELALRLCRAEIELDRLYRADFVKLLDELRAARETESALTTLLILHYLERMGDAIQNIGEAILLAVTGERLKFHQFRALEDALDAAELAPRQAVGGFTSIWGTRSGMRIGRVQGEPEAESSAAGDVTRRAIFKEGARDKLLLERDNIARWEQIAPGVAPRVLEFHEQGEDASLLLEFLEGATLQELLVDADWEAACAALQAVQHTLSDVWRRTRKSPDPGRSPPPANFVRQIRVRLDDVCRIHPHYRTPERRIGALSIPSLEERLSRAEQIEARLSAPFSTFIHGDFNVDNVIYEPQSGSVHFIDLHRSCDSDYVQDVSVFLVSVFRQPLFGRAVRRRLRRVAGHFLDFARGFARDAGDASFEPRLALGLTRSLLTSTRFEYNRRFADEMFLRAEYLLDRVLDAPGAGDPAWRVPDWIVSL